MIKGQRVPLRSVLKCVHVFFSTLGVRNAALFLDYYWFYGHVPVLSVSSGSPAALRKWGLFLQDVDSLTDVDVRAVNAAAAAILALHAGKAVGFVPL